jgi:hypothetical protein
MDDREQLHTRIGTPPMSSPKVDSISSTFFQLRIPSLLYQLATQSARDNLPPLLPHTDPRIHILQLTHTKEPALKLGKYASAFPSNAYGSDIDVFPCCSVGGKTMAGFGVLGSRYVAAILFLFSADSASLRSHFKPNLRYRSKVNFRVNIG